MPPDYDPCSQLDLGGPLLAPVAVILRVIFTPLLKLFRDTWTAFDSRSVYANTCGMKWLADLSEWACGGVFVLLLVSGFLFVAVKVLAALANARS
jgi:hypothetical protein